MLIKEIPEELEYIRHQLLEVAQFNEDLDINESDLNGAWSCGCYWPFTPLTWAASQGNLPLVQWLLDNGADIDKRDDDHGIYERRGYTPLMWATALGRDNVVKYLLENSANPHIERVFINQATGKKEKEDAYAISIRRNTWPYFFWNKAQKMVGYADFDNTQKLLRAYCKKS